MSSVILYHSSWLGKLCPVPLSLRTEAGCLTPRRLPPSPPEAPTLSATPCFFPEAACGPLRDRWGGRHKHRLLGSKLFDYSPCYTHDLELSNISFPTPATSLRQREGNLWICVSRELEDMILAWRKHWRTSSPTPHFRNGETEAKRAERLAHRTLWQLHLVLEKPISLGCHEK